MANPPGFMIYEELAESLVTLPCEDAGKLCQAMCNYFLSGKDPEDLPEVVKFSWMQIRRRISKDKRSYKITCIKRAYAADMKQLDDPLTYTAWFEWRKTRFSDVTDPVLKDVTMEDMLEIESNRKSRGDKE